METVSTILAIFAGNSPVPGEFPSQKPVTRSFDVFFDLRLINDWVNTGEAGDLRRYQAHYDVTLMFNIDGFYLVPTVFIRSPDLPNSTITKTADGIDNTQQLHLVPH